MVSVYIKDSNNKDFIETRDYYDYDILEDVQYADVMTACIDYSFNRKSDIYLLFVNNSLSPYLMDVQQRRFKYKNDYILVQDYFDGEYYTIDVLKF